MDKRLKNINVISLVKVLVIGLFASIILGILFGVLDFELVNLAGFSITGIIMFIAGRYIARYLRDFYEYPHLVYSIIIGILLFVMIYVNTFVYSFIFLQNYYGNIILDMTGEIMLFALKRLILPELNGTYLINTLFYIVLIYTGIKETTY